MTGIQSTGSDTIGVFWQGDMIGNVNEATITKYIAEQYERDRLEGETS